MDKKSIFLALFIFIIIALSLYFSFEENTFTPENPVKENKKLADEELEGVNFSVYSEDQKYELKIESQKLKNFRDEKNYMELDPLTAELYSLESGKLIYTLTGDFAIYYNQKAYLEIRGNVVIDSDNYQITAAEVDYYLNQNYIEGRGAVKIISKNFHSDADSFNSELNLENLNLIGDDQQADVKFKLN